MEQEISLLNDLILKNTKKILRDLDQAIIDQIRILIDKIIDDTKNKYPARSDAENYFLEIYFGDSRIRITDVIASFGTLEQLNKLINCAGVGLLSLSNRNRYYPIHHACINGRTDILKAIVEYDVNRNIVTSHETRAWHSIHFACRYNHLEIVKMLINLGVDKEVRTGFGLTPLHVACEFGNLQIVKYLLSLNVYKDPITIDENQNMTPIHYAVLGNFIEITELLLIVGVNRNKLDLQGFSCLDIASKANFVGMVKLLLCWGLKNVEASLEIAKVYKSQESIEVIEKYLQAKKNLFNKSNLKKIAPQIAKMMNEFNPTNLAKGIIKIYDNVEFNAFGINELSSQIGFFKKREVDFTQFVKELEIIELCEGADHINEVIVNGQNELAKISLSNI